MSGNWSRGRARELLTAALAGALLLTACATRDGLMAVVFEPQPPPQHVVHPPRREPYKPFVPRTIVIEVAPPKPNWGEMFALLPKDESGNANWVQAIADGAITPSPGVDAAAEEQPVLDLDVELVPKELPDMKVSYPHAIHTKLLACDTCHTGIFQMEAGADPITMEQIFAGEYCGRCHGKVAFDPVTSCPRCHRGLAQ
jgi:c(7)-type cytochrome triheme protein